MGYLALKLKLSKVNLNSILLRVDRWSLNKLKDLQPHEMKITGLKLTAICQLITI